MKFRYLPALMTLLAGAIVSIFSFIHRDELIMFLFKTVVAMAIFFTPFLTREAQMSYTRLKRVLCSSRIPPGHLDTDRP